MAVRTCGTPISPVLVGLEISTPCETLVPPTPCGVGGFVTPCAEDHTLEIVTTQFAASLTTSNQWEIPACNQYAQVVIPGLKTAHINSWLWSADYGYFLITAFNPGANSLTVANPCVAGNKSPGTIVPACSEFIVSIPPCSITNNSIVYLTSNFVVPAVGNCTTVSVTDTTGLQAGYDIVLAGTSQQFHISQVISLTSLQICNAGSGGSPGSTVTWQNGAGDYQYPIIISNSSTVISERKSSNVISLDSAHPTQQVKLSDPTSQVINYVNPSQLKAAQLYYTIQAYVSGTVQNANTSLLAYNMQLKESKNGASLLAVTDEDHSKYTSSDASASESKQATWSGVASIPPGQPFTLDAQVVLAFTGTGAATFTIDELVLSVVGLVVLS